MLLSEPKTAKIVKPNIKVVDITTQKGTRAEGSIFEITLSSEAVAPFVLLDFDINSEIRGEFSDNGFFMFENYKTITFFSRSSFQTTKQIRDNLKVKTVSDVQ